VDIERKAEGKRPQGRPGHRWEDNIKWILKVEWGGLDLIDLAQDKVQLRAFVNMKTNLQVP
jgi:hypothetical protein